MQARDFFDEPPAEPARERPPRRERSPQREREPMKQHSEPMNQHSDPVAQAPAPAYTPAPIAQPVAFHAVSEHDAVTEESHKPVRRRRQDHVEATPQEPSLQLVETQVEVQPAVLAPDEDAPKRTKPRRRR